MSNTLKILALLTMILLSTGCADERSSAARATEALSRELRPADADLAALYIRSCRSCHTVAATGSPLTGDAAAWAERMDKGMNVLLDNVINGYGGMPPFGLCMDCDAAQFEALIRFMAEPAQASVAP
jgi:cytochrome c5